MIFKIYYILCITIFLVRTSLEENQIDDNKAPEENEINDNKARQYVQDYTEAMENYLRAAFNMKVKSIKGADNMTLTEVFEQQAEGITVYNSSLNIALAIHHLKSLPSNSIKDHNLQRNIDRILGLRISSFTPQEIKHLRKLHDYFKTFSDELKYCQFEDSGKCDLNSKGILHAMITTRNLKEIEYYWNQEVDFYKQTKDSYLHVRDLYKKAAKEYNSTKDMFFRQYDDGSVYHDIVDVLRELRPFYEQLHAYIRYTLQKEYGETLVPDRSPISEPLMIMFITKVGNLENLPYNRKNFSLTESQLNALNYTPRHIIEDADDFFDTMNMERVPSSFWDNAVMHNTESCSLELLYPGSGSDLVLSYCDDVSVGTFRKMHQIFLEMQYILNTKDLPYLDRGAYWPGFSDAVKFATLLSVDSPNYLKKIGVWHNVPYNRELNINRLYTWSLALFFKIIQSNFIITHLIDELEREEPHNNCEYWDLKTYMTGVKPPSIRKSDDFDFGSDFNMAISNRPTRYIFEMILSFQIYEALCQKAQQFYEPEYGYLNACDFSASADAGEALKKMMRIGSTKSWRDVLQELTGEKKLKASAILKFFEPLRHRLTDLNVQNNVHVGWDQTKHCE